MNALLVEDNRGDVTLIQVALESVSSDVALHVVDDGVKALEFLRREGGHAAAPRPDFILLDLKLPRKTGLEVLSEIKRDPDLRRIPVIVLTSSDAGADVRRAYELHAAAYFVKPLTGFEEIIGTIVRFMGIARTPGNGDGASRPGAASAGRPREPSAAPPGGGALASWPRERALAALVESSPDAIIGADPDGTIATWTPAAERLYGHTAGEAVGRHVRLVVPEEGHGELEAVLAVARRGERAGELDTARADGRGRTIHVSIAAAPIRDERGDVAGIALVARDVTARRQSEEKFRLAVESSPNAIVMVDDRGRIVMVNAETERLFGYGRGELIGRTVDLLVPERFRAQHPRHRASFMERPEARPMGAGRDLFGLRRDGSEFPVEIGLRPIETPGGTVVLSAIVDITERTQAQEALARQADELSRSNAELEQFAYVASHDLQEPLRTVASYTDLLARRYADRLDGEAKSYLQFAREGAIRMQRLIQGLLALSRVSTRGRDLVPVDAGQALQQALANLRLSVEESRARIACGDLPTITADRTQLVELFQNLVGNALKFRGTEPPRVEIAARARGGEWLFSVRDNGIGIDPDSIGRLFQVFQRLHDQDAYPGTGIGLAICRRIVERLGGRIWVESVPGAGSTFLFAVPMGRPGGPARGPARDRAGE